MLWRFLRAIWDDLTTSTVHTPDVDETACRPIRHFICKKCGNRLSVPAEVTWCCGNQKLTPVENQ